MNKKKILVTGGLGFIGGHVMEELSARGFYPVAYDRIMKTDRTMLPNCEYEVFIGDIRDANAVSTAVSMCEGAINLAGILGTSEAVNNPFPAAEANILGGLNFLQACREHKKRGVQIAVGNHFMNNTYSITKTTTERFALMFNKEHGTKIAVVRGLNAYGERQKHKPIRKITPNFVTKALRGEKITIFGSGESVMDMIYVKDLAKILVDALVGENVRFDTIYSAGPGVATTVKDIARIINEITGNAAGVEHIEMRQGEVDNSIVLGEPETLIDLYPNGFKFNSIEEGMKKTVEWFKEFYPWQED
jgi:nucleoside-diphosphate-sugar epimerase